MSFVMAKLKNGGLLRTYFGESNGTDSISICFPTRWASNLLEELLGLLIFKCCEEDV